MNTTVVKVHRHGPAPKVTDLQLLTFIAAYAQHNGFAPCVRDIGNGVGLASTSAVTHRLKQLAKKGLLNRHERISRAMSLTQKAREQYPMLSPTGSHATLRHVKSTQRSSSIAAEAR
jgi:SOS-response transcriptional repressor LexA